MTTTFESIYKMHTQKQAELVNYESVSQPLLDKELLIIYFYSSSSLDYGISPFCMCSVIMCLCISPKLSNSLPHDLHFKYLERSSV
jgi:hypothetical protein